MSSCCERPEHVWPVSTGTCPVSGSGTKSARVDLQTVKALLTMTALQRLEPGDYRFCPAAGCDAVYFDDRGHVFSTSDVRVGVWQKQPEGNRTICYCFGENESDIATEIDRDGRSQALERVRAHIQAGRCACEVRNPRGVCCLGDVAAAIARRVTAGSKRVPLK
jgi:transposase